MKAVLRLGAVLLAAGAGTAPPAIAQDPPTNQSDAVGPQELQDFNLQGNASQPAQPPAEEQSAPPELGPANSEEQPASAPRSAPAGQAQQPRQAADSPRPNGTAPNQTALAARTSEPLRQTAPASSVTVALPRLDGGIARSSAAAAAPVPAQFPVVPSEASRESGLPLLAWLLAALAGTLGAGFLWWRTRTRPAFAGGPGRNPFVAPEPAPSFPPPGQPQPAGATPPRPIAQPPAARPTPAAQPASSLPTGLVATRLRPRLEIAFHPLLCVVDEQQVAVEFAVEILNIGNALARNVLAEATLFNASPNQESELQAFFAKPIVHPDPIESIEPLKTIQLRTQVVAPRANMQIFELAGRKLFVPVIAINASYRWSSGEGRTSAAFLLGRDMGTDKLAPVRADLGPRAFDKLAARLLPIGLKR